MGHRRGENLYACNSIKHFWVENLWMRLKDSSRVGRGLYLVNITFLTGLVLTFLVAFCNKKEKLVF